MGTRNAYLALGYACNERCRCCPLVHKNDREKFISFDRLLQEADQMVSYGVTDVTLSGGEPTLHPDIIQLVKHFHDNKIGVHILSNGERFSDIAFADEFLKLCMEGRLTVTTTFHSWNAIEHEYQNGSQGSFLRSLNGLKYLDRNGLQVSIKHCITKNNYQYLTTYLRFVLESFSSQAEIQFWGIDLYGMEREQAQENFVDFQLIRPYIQEAVDIFEASGRARRQALNINNLPLCMCDCYYWRYFTSPEKDFYVAHNENGSILEANSGPASIRCKECLFRHACMGAYFSNFELLGDDIVSVPKMETAVANARSRYFFYTGQTIGKVVFSPYLIHRLSRNGYLLINYMTKGEVLLRLRAEQILYLQNILMCGTQLEELVTCLNEFGLDGTAVVDECMRKGIIE